MAVNFRLFRRKEIFIFAIIIKCLLLPLMSLNLNFAGSQTREYFQSLWNINFDKTIYMDFFQLTSKLCHYDISQANAKWYICNQI